MAETTFYAKGSAKEFLEEKGFDKKWSVQDDKKKKKDGWEEVLIKGSKKMNKTEKLERAQKISANVLKNADAVRVDLDGEKLMKLVEKDTRRREGLSKQEKTQEPQEGGAKKAAGAKAAAPKAAKEEKKKPANKNITMTPAQLRSKLHDLMASHLEKPDLQLLSLAELFEEMYTGKVEVWTWSAEVADYQSSPSSWNGLPLSLVHADTRDVAASWLNGMAESELATFLDFLVGTAMPGGGPSGRGGAKPYYGLIALLQLLLQKCGAKRKWHEDGRRITSNVLQAEGRVSAISTPAVLWMLVQLAESCPLAALRGWFASISPVVENERAGGGKLAIHCVAVLKHILQRLPGAKSDGGVPPVSLDQLLKLMELFYPLRSEGDAKSASTSVSTKNPQAFIEMAKLCGDIIEISPVGLQASSCASSVVPAVLPLVCSDSHSDMFRTCALGLLVRVLGSDKKGLKVWEQCHTTSLKGSAVVARELSGRWSGLGVEAAALEKTMKVLISSGEELLGSKDNKDLSQAAMAARKNKAQKRAAKQEEMEDFIKACQTVRSRLAMRRTGRNVAWLGLACFVASGIAAGLAVTQPECWPYFQPIVQGAAGVIKGKGASPHVTYPVVEAAVKACADSLVKRASGIPAA